MRGVGMASRTFNCAIMVRTCYEQVGGESQGLVMTVMVLRRWKERLQRADAERLTMANAICTTANTL